MCSGKVLEGVQLQRNAALGEAGCAEIAPRLCRDCAKTALRSPLPHRDHHICAEIGLGSCLIFITVFHNSDPYKMRQLSKMADRLTEAIKFYTTA